MDKHILNQKIDVDTLQKSDAFRSALEHAPFAALIFAADDKLTLQWRNAAHAKMTSTPDLDVTGLGMFEAFPPNGDGDGSAAAAGIVNAVARIQETGEPEDIGPYRFDLIDEKDTYIQHHWLIRMSPIKSGSTTVAILQIAEDVTQKVLTALLSETLIRAAGHTTSVSYFSFDPENGRFIRGEGVDRMFGFEPGQVGNDATPFFERVHPDDVGGVYAEVGRVFAAPRGEIASFDYRVQLPDGGERFIRIRGEVATDPEDRREKLVGTFVDLTDLEVNRLALVKALELRESLISEANHRIKNSLQMAISMLRSEVRAIASAEAMTPENAIERLNAVQARIRAVADVHGLMQIGAESAFVSVNDLMRKVIGFNQAAVDLGDDTINCTMPPEDTTVSSDIAVCLGLIINELLTNALKYGIGPEGQSDIEALLEKDEAHTTITIKNRIYDNPKFSEITTTNMGAGLVAQLSNQIGAEITTDKNGTQYIARLRF